MSLHFISVFSENQFDFKEGLNTELALHNFINGIYHGFNLNLKFIGLFSYIKKSLIQLIMPS